MIHHLVSAIGLFAFAGIAWLLSSNRRKVSWKTVASGLALQLALGLLIFQFPGSHRVFLWMNDAVLALLNASKSGTAFLFGPLAASPGEPGSVGFILIFQVLPIAIFFAAFTSALYHLRVLHGSFGFSPGSFTARLESAARNRFVALPTSSSALSPRW